MKNITTKFSILTLSLLVLFASTSTAGTTYTYPSVNPALSITFPDNWTVEQDPDYSKGIVATTPDEEIEIDLWPLSKKELEADPEKALDQAALDVAGLIVQWVTDFNGGEPVNFKLNNIDFCEVKGTAKDKEDGSPVDVSVTFFTPDNTNIFVMMYWGSPEEGKKFEKDLTEIAKSIKKP